METNMFDIRTQSTIDIELPKDSFGTVFILGKSPVLPEKVDEAFFRIRNSLDTSASVYHYGVKLLATDPDDYNVICPIQDPASGRAFYVVAKAEQDELDLAVTAVINEAESRMLRFTEEALIIAAMEDPGLFAYVADSVIEDRNGDQYSDDCILPCCPPPGSNRHEAHLGITKNAKKKRFSTISARQKMEAFEKLPARLNKAFREQNPEEFEIIRQTMGTYSPAEMYAIVMHLAERRPHLLRDIHSTALNSASRYEIHVRPWRSAYRKDFKDRYLYCIYLRNARGKEFPVTFKNYPAYCIYMMYILDRARRGDEVTDLSIKDLRDEFCALYKTILSETDQNIIGYFETMDYRKISETGKLRKGRYDDYIKDIHDTLEKLVGEIDSIPLKVGHGRALGLKPERIFIDEKLARFKFA